MLLTVCYQASAVPNHVFQAQTIYSSKLKQNHTTKINWLQEPNMGHLSCLSHESFDAEK